MVHCDRYSVPGTLRTVHLSTPDGTLYKHGFTISICTGLSVQSVFSTPDKYGFSMFIPKNGALQHIHNATMYSGKMRKLFLFDPGTGTASRHPSLKLPAPPVQCTPLQPVRFYPWVQCTGHSGDLWRALWGLRVSWVGVALVIVSRGLSVSLAGCLGRGCPVFQIEGGGGPDWPGREV